MKNSSVYNHIPVLKDEIIQWMVPLPNKRYIDATIGMGGHTQELLQHGSRVLGIDQDRHAIASVKKRFQHELLAGGTCRLVHANFNQLEQRAQEKGFEQVDGIIFDLGFSSWQLDESGRGFSFQKNEPLDMRLDKDRQSVTGRDFLNTCSYEEIYTAIGRYGEEEHAACIAREIIRQRPLNTTDDLSRCVGACVPKSDGRRHHARVFQAVRIAVNNELENLKQALPQAEKLLKKGGVLCIISFQSLEDRIVKQYIQSSKQLDATKLIRPSEKEMIENPRAKSARLRIAYKL